MIEYLANPHFAACHVQELREQWNGINGTSIKQELNALIKDHPDLIEAYNLRREILEHEDNLSAAEKEIKRTYLAIMIHYFEDKLPESMPWGWLENRPILKALSSYTEHLWIHKKDMEAETLFQKILSMNPSDNQGVRFSYLAFLENLSYSRFQEMIIKGIHLDWFKEHCCKHEQLKTYWES